MNFLKNILIICTLIALDSLDARRVGETSKTPTQSTTQPAVAPVKPVVQPSKPAPPTVQPTPTPAPAQQAPAKPVAQPQSFSDYMTQIRTAWKPADVINDQGIFTDKFIDFVSSARFDTVLVRTLLETGKNIYLPLPASNEESANILLASDEMIETTMILYENPFYDPKTNLFKQDYLDAAADSLEDTNPDIATLDTFRNDMLERLRVMWGTIGGAKDTALLSKQALQQINASLETYGLIKPPIAQPATPQPQPKPQPIEVGEITAIQKNSTERTLGFVKRLLNVDTNKQQIMTILFKFNEKTQQYDFAVDAQKKSLAKRIIRSLIQNIKMEYPNIDNDLIIGDLAFGLSICPAKPGKMDGLGQFVRDAFEKVAESQPKPAAQQPKPTTPTPAQPPAPAAQPKQPTAVKPVAQPASLSSLKIGNTQITIVKGDIIDQQVDAIVNAANDGLQHDGGVALAISKAAGPQLQAHCNKMPLKPEGTKCPTGQAVITPAFDLEQKGIKKIIHATGPFGTDVNRKQLLTSAYQNSLQVALDNKLKSVAFPAISTAIFGYKIDEATPVAFAAVRDFIKQHPNVFDEIRFVLFSDEDLGVYKKWIGELRK